MKARHIRFIGFTDVPPKREGREIVLDENDLLRAVLLAEDFNDGRWVIFECEDRMHAIKAANKIKTYGFDVRVQAGGRNIYLRANLTEK